jgi:hypothetical protein
MLLLSPSLGMDSSGSFEYGLACDGTARSALAVDQRRAFNYKGFGKVAGTRFGKRSWLV